MALGAFVFNSGPQHPQCGMWGVPEGFQWGGEGGGHIRISYGGHGQGVPAVLHPIHIRFSNAKRSPSYASGASADILILAILILAR